MKTNRLAVSTIFFFIGFVYANWVARLPELQRFYGVTDAQLGTLLLCWAAGAVVAMPFTGWLTVQLGSRRLTQVTATLLCVFAPLIPVFPNVWFVSGLFFFLGMNNGALDVSVNGQAVYVERMYEKPIMSSFHAVFSVGMALGAGTGALFAKMNVPLVTHILAICGFCMFLLGWANLNLIKDDKSKNENPIQDTSNEEKKAAFQLPTKAILPLGIIAFCGMTGEGSMADWSAIYMNKTIGMDEAFSALAFGAFGTSMTVGRIFGDYFANQVGKRKVLIYSSLLCFLGLSLALILPNPYVVLFGFFCVGLGLANIVPIIYSAAGNTEGVAPSVGIAMATTIGYAGFFVGPPIIGFLSDAFSLKIGLLFTLALFVVMFFLVYKRKL